MVLAVVSLVWIFLVVALVVFINVFKQKKVEQTNKGVNYENKVSRFLHSGDAGSHRR